MLKASLSGSGLVRLNGGFAPLVVRYIGKDNPTLALSFGKELSGKTLLLAEHPELGRKGRPGFTQEVRELIAHSNYIVFHRVLHEVRTVEILRVKHAAPQEL